MRTVSRKRACVSGPASRAPKPIAIGQLFRRLLGGGIVAAVEQGGAPLAMMLAPTVLNAFTTFAPRAHAPHAQNAELPALLRVLFGLVWYCLIAAALVKSSRINSLCRLAYVLLKIRFRCTLAVCKVIPSRSAVSATLFPWSSWICNP